MPTSSTKGRIAEDSALAFLQQQGLTLIRRNYRSPRGEIDLIMLDRDTTAFVEVRARTNSNILHAVETIDQNKQKKIILSSQHYMQCAEKTASRFYRYDVVTLNGPLHKANIEWIKNAFDA